MHMCGGGSSSEPPGFPAARQPLNREPLTCHTAHSTARFDGLQEMQQQNVAETWACNSFRVRSAGYRLDGQGVIARFVVGHSADPKAEAAMQQEIARHGDFLQLDVTVRLSHYRQSPQIQGGRRTESERSSQRVQYRLPCDCMLTSHASQRHYQGCFSVLSRRRIWT